MNSKSVVAGHDRLSHTSHVVSAVRERQGTATVLLRSYARTLMQPPPKRDSSAPFLARFGKLPRYIHDHSQCVPIRAACVPRRAVAYAASGEGVCAAPAVRRVARARFARPRIPGDGTAELVDEAWDDTIWRTWSRRSKAAGRHTQGCGIVAHLAGAQGLREGSRKWSPL